ncbi:hypothetical protein [Microvirga puerhi]|uniref:Uncharacterized protein n=1 Tax=Microvirga puerhi TaxID=2876078 RepID=A0ABS7VKA9_9HYPH|nr:hypothetical protein [Microvirga puerhi]MBZ6075601.1 hypothetical protein [Microvirga puerhi]
MWPKQNQIRELEIVLARIQAASAIDDGLARDVMTHACPRLAIALRPSLEATRLIDAEAWVDLGFWLISWELPDWVIHRLSCDDRGWSCTICIRGLAINWVEDFAEFQHHSPALAILGAFVQAQILKVQGEAPSNVTPFRRHGHVEADLLENKADR